MPFATIFPVFSDVAYFENIKFMKKKLYRRANLTYITKLHKKGTQIEAVRCRTWIISFIVVVFFFAQNGAVVPVSMYPINFRIIKIHLCVRTNLKNIIFDDFSFSNSRVFISTI